MSVAAFIRRCLSVGMDIETALQAAEAMEATAMPNLSVRQARNKRYYESRKRLKASETSEIKTPDGASENRLKASENVLNSDAPRARGENNPSRLVDTRTVVVGVTREANSDEWPEGDAKDHARLLVERVNAGCLDPSKSLNLVTTTGRLAAWRRDGASWLHDVLPVVDGLCANRRQPINSWKFFDAAIAQSIADNRAALVIPEAASVRATGPPAKHWSAQANDVQAEAKRRLLGAG